MRLLLKLSITAALLSGVVFAAGNAEAAPRHLKPVFAYDQFWRLRNPGGPVELNPQPLPPGARQGIIIIGGHAAWQADELNPQPLPPKARFGNGLY